MRWRGFLKLIPTFVLIGVAAYLFRPFYLDFSPPAIQLSLFSERCGDRLLGSLSAMDDKAGIAEMSVEIRGENGFKQPIFSGKGRRKGIEKELSVDLRFVPEGRYVLFAEARDASIWRNQSSRRVEFVVDHTPPKLDVRLTPSSPRIGGAISIHIKASEPVYPGITVVDPNLFGSSSFTLYRLEGEGREFLAVLGLSLEGKPGRSSVYLSFNDRAGNRSDERLEFDVRPVEFGMRFVFLPPEKARLLTDRMLIEEDQRKLAEVGAMAGSERKLWRGRFSMPVEGTITSRFGEFRVYNGGVARSRHMGVDIKAEEGTPVRAANDGIVIFAGRLNVRGNTVIIDHGLGVRSHYCHLRSMVVREGDEVSKGDVIGEVGSTGRAIGPHLHWAIEVNGRFVDPVEWTRYEF